MEEQKKTAVKELMKRMNEMSERISQSLQVEKIKDITVAAFLLEQYAAAVKNNENFDMQLYGMLIAGTKMETTKGKSEDVREKINQMKLDRMKL